MKHCLSEDASILFNGAVHPELKLSVIVPAKDESEGIMLTLDALRNQKDLTGEPLCMDCYEVMVLVNNCSDDTLAICEAYQQTYPSFNLHLENVELKKDVAHIGTVRRLLMDAAYRRLSINLGCKGIIVSTDADSQVDEKWVQHILLEINSGADVVGGRIIPRDVPLLSKQHHLQDITYRFFQSRLEAQIDPCPANPWPRHFQCFGPSLAVTCEIYDRAGRLPAIPYLEDEEFRKALKRIDAKIRHAPDVRVFTSSRLKGRVEFGFSVQLKQWSEMTGKHEEQMVDSLDTLTFKYKLKNMLRIIWLDKEKYSPLHLDVIDVAKLAEHCPDDLMNLLSSSQFFETFWEQIDIRLKGSKLNKSVLQPISEVIRSFRFYFSGADKTTVNHIRIMPISDINAIAV